MDEPILMLPVFGNMEVVILQIALENYFKSNRGTPKDRNQARHLFNRLNKELTRVENQS